MLSKNLVTANVVVAANTFNVTIFNQLWLVKNEIFTEDELTSSKSSVYLPVVTQVGTDYCDLIIVPERLQMTLHDPKNPDSSLDKVRKIVDLLPQTPYTALGLNIVWHLSAEETEEIGIFTRRNFMVPNHSLYEHFNCEDARFGAYISRNYENFRLKLDIKPLKYPSTDLETIQLHFNFHLELSTSDNKAASIKNNLKKWNEAYSESETVVSFFL